MKHIKEEYGTETNLLQLTHEELIQLEPFLNALGIRCRCTRWDSKDCIIQAENSYRVWIRSEERKRADNDMTDDSINCYKR